MNNIISYHIIFTYIISYFTHSEQYCIISYYLVDLDTGYDPLFNEDIHNLFAING